MRIILTRTNKENNYEDVYARSQPNNIIIYYNKPLHEIKKQEISKTKFVPEIKYSEFPILGNISKLQNRLIYLADYDKYTFDNFEELDKFIDFILKISSRNTIYGFSITKNYMTLYNRVKGNMDFWNELTRNLKYDANFKSFCKYLKDKEDEKLYIEVFGFYTFMLYELAYRARNDILTLQ